MPHAVVIVHLIPSLGHCNNKIKPIKGFRRYYCRLATGNALKQQKVLI